MDFKTLLVVFFYNTIKGFVLKVLPALGIPEDVMMLLIGYLLSKYTKYAWIGEGIMYGAAAALGASGGISLGSLFGGQVTTQSQTQQSTTKVLG